jgi:hypothetical protein
LNRINYSAVSFPKKPHPSKFRNNNVVNNNNNNKKNFNNKTSYNNSKSFKPTASNNYNNSNRRPVCPVCLKEGHTANKCFKNKQAARVNQVEPQQQQKPPERVLTCTENQVTNMMHVTGSINGAYMQLYFDSGATTSVMSSRAAKKHNFNIIDANVRVKVANNEVTQAVGVTEKCVVNVHNHTCEIKFIVMDHDDHDVLLGLDWFMATGAGLFPAEGMLSFPGEKIYVQQRTDFPTEENFAIETIVDSIEELSDTEEGYGLMVPGPTASSEPTNFKPEVPLNAEQSEEFNNVKESFIEISAANMKTLGVCTIAKHRIRVMDVAPIHVHSYRRSREEANKLTSIVQELLAHGIIEPSTSPWSSPAFCIVKNDKSFRLLVDYRKVNSVTHTEHWPLPRIDDILDRLSGSKVFTTLDLTAGYYQIAIDGESRLYTAFSTPDGHYQFTRLPMGLKNAPAAFMRIMHQILGDLKFVEIYIDDLTIHSRRASQAPADRLRASQSSWTTDQTEQEHLVCSGDQSPRSHRLWWHSQDGSGENRSDQPTQGADKRQASSRIPRPVQLL